MRKTALLLVPACSMVPYAGYAQTEPRAVIDISVSGTGDSNPFLIADGKSAGSVTIKVDPKVYWDDENSNVAIDGSLRFSQYTNRYGNDVGARLGARGSRKLDERTSLTASAGLQSSRSTLQDSFFGNISGPLDPLTFPDVPLTDVTIAGRRIRVNTLDASIGLERILGESNVIGVTASTSYVKFGGQVGLDYRMGSLAVRYSRRLSERTMVTGSVEASVADYIGFDSGDAKIISPQVGIENKVSERLTWTANIGIAYASVDDQFSVSRSKVYPAANLSLCNTGIRTTICGSISRSAGPTALGGISAVSNVTFNYQQQLSLKDSFSLSARYGRTDQNSDRAFAAISRDNEIVGASATYTRDMNERFALFAVASATKIFEKQLRSEANYSVSVGVRLRIGKLR